MVLGDGDFGRWLGLEEVMTMGSPWWDCCPYEEGHWQLAVSLSLPREDTPRKRLPTSQGQGSHGDPAAGTLITDFQPPEL